MNKLDIVKQIKTFMYDQSLSDPDNGVNVITYCYLRSVLFNIYKNNYNTLPYSIIAGDFNKLGDLNKTYGLEEGDRCMKDSLKIISDILPDFSIICRNGGDEFVFIIPEELDNNTLKSYIRNIYQTLEQNKESLHGLSISLSFGHSKEAFSLEDLYEKVDKRVDIVKEKNNIKMGDYYSSYKTLHNALRLSDDFQFTNEQIKHIMSLGMEATFDMLKTYQRTGQFSIYDSSVENEIDTKNERRIDYTTLNKINNIFIQNKMPSDDEINSLSVQNLIYLSKKLVYNEMTHAFTKDYFLNYLKDNLIYPEYKLSLLSLSGLKLANLMYGHNMVDKYLTHTIYKNVEDNIDTQVPISNMLFSVTADCYKIYLGGGDILYIEHPDSHYRPKPEFYENNAHKISDSEDTMSLLTSMLQYSKISSTKPIDKDSIMTGPDNWVTKATTMFKSAKDAFKNDLLENRHFVDIMKHCIKPDLQAYVKVHPNDYLSAENVKEFFNKESKALLDHHPTKDFLTDKESLFKPEDFHVDFAYDTSYGEYIKSKKTDKESNDDFDIDE